MALDLCGCCEACWGNAQCATFQQYFDGNSPICLLAVGTTCPLSVQLANVGTGGVNVAYYGNGPCSDLTL